MSEWKQALDTALELARRARGSDPLGVAERSYIQHASDIVSMMRCGSCAIRGAHIERCLLDRKHDGVCRFEDELAVRAE